MFGASSELAPNMFGASSELAPNMFGASSELASVMEFGFKQNIDVTLTQTHLKTAKLRQFLSTYFISFRDGTTREIKKN